MIISFGDLPQLLSALFFVAIGAVGAIVQYRVFRVPQMRAILLYVWHTAFCLFYLNYTASNVADTAFYFERSLDGDIGFGLGGQSVILLTSVFSQGLGMSYGGVFMVYNLFGFLGLLALASAVQSTVQTKPKRTRQLSLLVLFLPGFSFWSSAIGKDSISFMAVGLASWSALRLGRRYPAMVIAVLALVCVRPHIAGFLLIALAFATIVAARTSAIRKVLLGAAITSIAFYSARLALEYTGLGTNLSVNGIGAYFEQRQTYNLGGSSSVELAAMSIPFRLFSYSFRPFFFDAGGMLGLAVSIENLVMLFLFLGFLKDTVVNRTQLTRFQKTFFLLFVVMSWLVLANTTANLGIAIRQKMMFTPMLLILVFSYKRRARIVARRTPGLKGLVPDRA